jgi:2-isopropylmalate synthase
LCAFCYPVPMKQKKHIQIFDTTLRDGAQMPGVSFSARDKLAIAERLDDMGIDFIEGGFPASNEKDRHFFAQAQKRKWKHAKICSFGSTHHKKFTPNNDPCLAALIESATPVVVLFGKSSKFHAEKILEVSPEKNLEIIEGSVRKITKNGQQVIFDAEHFFDGFLADPEYSMQCLLAAERGGAINLTLADTNGGILPRTDTKCYCRSAKKSTHTTGHSCAQRQRLGGGEFTHRHFFWRYTRTGNHKRNRRTMRQCQSL